MSYTILRLFHRLRVFSSKKSPPNAHAIQPSCTSHVRIIIFFCVIIATLKKEPAGFTFNPKAVIIIRINCDPIRAALATGNSKRVFLFAVHSIHLNLPRLPRWWWRLHTFHQDQCLVALLTEVSFHLFLVCQTTQKMYVLLRDTAL